MNINYMNYSSFINDIKNKTNYYEIQKEINSLPSDIKISTMTICFSFNTTLNIENISKYLKLKKNLIIAIGKRILTDNNNKKYIKKQISFIKDAFKLENSSTIKGKKRGRKPKNIQKNNIKLKKKKKTVFYNQISLKIIVPNKKNNKPVNVKLFNNGSVQMTGCVTLQDSYDTIFNLIKILNKKQSYIDFKNNSIVDTPFISNDLEIDNSFNLIKIINNEQINENLEINLSKKNIDYNYDLIKCHNEKQSYIDSLNNSTIEFFSNKLDINSINKYEIGMINSGFKMPFSNDRSKLATKLLNDNWDVSYDRNIHASVIIKLSYKIKKINDEIVKKEVTILVFEKGSIIITGANKCYQINDAYNIINKYLLENYKDICKKQELTLDNVYSFLISN